MSALPYTVQVLMNGEWVDTGRFKYIEAAQKHAASQVNHHIYTGSLAAKQATTRIKWENENA